ncbi:hypothetical protein BST61_g8528 [Cercospora zeina]
MVAGKTSREALARAAQTTTPKLPPLPKLRVRKPNKGEANPCLAIMSSMLGCWASSGYSTAGCAAIEQQLRGCATDADSCHQTWRGIVAAANGGRRDGASPHNGPAVQVQAVYDHNRGRDIPMAAVLLLLHQIPWIPATIRDLHPS